MGTQDEDTFMEVFRRHGPYLMSAMAHPLIPGHAAIRKNAYTQREQLREVRAVKGYSKHGGAVCFFLIRPAWADRGDLLEWNFSTSLGEEYKEEWRIVDWDRMVSEVQLLYVQRYSRELADVALALRTEGLAEAADYLQAARDHLLKAVGPTAFADCRTSCRNALTSALAQLSGVTGYRAAIKVLAERGFFGQKEGEFLGALEEVMVKLQQVNGKMGPHPPMAGNAEAELSFSLTEATLKYLVERKRRV
jgi:hypothetical protein